MGDGWAVIFSHSRNFTPVCTNEFRAVAQLDLVLPLTATSGVESYIALNDACRADDETASHISAMLIGAILDRAPREAENTGLNSKESKGEE